jgi:uncharacterized membrane protein YcaP (DUF421 family)
MDTVLRSVAVYVFLLVIFRISGKRSLSQITTFDFILLLIISEATQQALVGDDFSIINTFVVVASLVVLDVTFSWVERRWPSFGRVVESLPVVIVEHGRMLDDRASREGVTLPDVLAAGRETHGLERLEQIKYAILERHGGISVVPTKDAR